MEWLIFNITFRRKQESLEKKEHPKNKKYSVHSYTEFKYCTCNIQNSQMCCQKNIEVLGSFETFYSKNVTEYLVIKLLNLLLKEVLAIGLIKKFKAYHAYT